MKQVKKGFTLVELLVVIAILAILATVSVVGYTSFINKANKSADEQAVTQINLVLEAAAVSGDKITSPKEVKNLLRENGYSADVSTYYSAYTLAYYPAENVVVLVEGDKVVYPKEFENVAVADVEFLNETSVTTLDGFKTELEALKQENAGYASIRLQENLTFNNKEIAEIGKGNELELDLNGKTIESSASIPLQVTGDGDITISNGTIKATTNEQLTGAVLAKHQGDVTLDNCVVESHVYGVVTNGQTTSGSTVTIEDSTITSAVAIYFNDSKGTLILRNSTFNGSVIIAGGTVVIENCTFNGTYENHCDYKGAAIKLWTDAQVVEEYKNGDTNGTRYAECGSDEQNGSNVKDGGWSYGDGLLIIENRNSSNSTYILTSVTIKNSTFKAYTKDGAEQGYGLRIINIYNTSTTSYNLDGITGSFSTNVPGLTK